MIKALIPILVLGGFFDPSPVGDYWNPTPMTVVRGSEARFVLQRVECVSDAVAYNHTREIVILHDNATGKDYIGVSGIGITEMGTTGGKHPSETEQ